MTSNLECRGVASGDLPRETDSGLEVSVVMPCLNEAETIATCIEKAAAALRQHGLHGEIVVGDNGSDDGSIELAEALGARVAHVSDRGYGAAIIGAIEASRGRLIVFADADDSYDFGELPKFVDQLRNGYDLVMGCRLPTGGGRIMPNAMPWKHRWLGTPVLTAVSRLFFKTKISDINAGMRGLTRAAFDAMDLRTTGMEFASEMIIKATMMNMRCCEVPITLYPDGRSRPPHLRSWRDGWRHLRFMLLFSPRWLFVVPGATLFLIGLTVHGLLLPGRLHIGSVSFDINTQLVSALAMLLGFQSISLGVFAKSFAVSEGLMPAGSKLDRIGRLLRLEVGVLVGIAIVAVGAGLLLWAVLIWAEKGFGPLANLDVGRIVIASVTIVILGFQIISASFFLGVLNLKRRRTKGRSNQSSESKKAVADD